MNPPVYDDDFSLNDHDHAQWDRHPSPPTPEKPPAVAPTRVSFGSVTRESWRIYKKHFGECIGGAFLAFAVTMAFSWIIGVIIQAIMFTAVIFMVPGGGPVNVHEVVAWHQAEYERELAEAEGEKTEETPVGGDSAEDAADTPAVDSEKDSEKAEISEKSTRRGGGTAGMESLVNEWRRGTGQSFDLGTFLMFIGVVGFFVLLMILLMSLFQSWIGVGFLRYYTGITLGRGANLGLLFSGLNKMISFFLYGLLTGVIFCFLYLLGAAVCIGAAAGMHTASADPSSAAAFFFGFALLTILVVLYFSIRFAPGFWLIAARNMKVFEALHYSFAITRGNVGTAFLLGIWSMFLAFLGMMALGIGLIFVIPYVYMYYVVFCRQAAWDYFQE